MNCTKCHCPETLGHNRGCPQHPESTEQDRIDWGHGNDRGFNDSNPMNNSELSHSSRSNAFKLGYRAGRDRIDELADEEAQSRCFG